LNELFRSVNLAVDLTHELLNKALDSISGAGHPFVDSIVMSLLLLVKRLSHAEALRAIEKACQGNLFWFECTSGAYFWTAITGRVDFSMDKTSAAACQLVSTYF
jgi:hypothetical protein